MGIEGNTLSIDQVTAIIENKRVIAPQKDILEVKNAIIAYDFIHGYKASSLPSFLKAHSILLKGLVRKPGNFRSFHPIVRLCLSANRITNYHFHLHVFERQELDVNISKIKMIKQNTFG